jgi:hypothetical protein
MNTTTPSVSRFALPLLLTINAAVVAWLWYPGPEDTAKAALAIGLWPCLWLWAWLGAGRSRDPAIQRHYQVVRQQLTLGAAVLLVGLGRWVALRLQLVDDVEVWRRVVFVAWGIFLFDIGNRLPKILPPLREDRAVRPFRRFAGWVLAILGATMVVLFLLTPIEWAKFASQVLTVICVLLLVVARLVDVFQSPNVRAGLQSPIE